jgi:hypothetical protein
LLATLLKQAAVAAQHCFPKISSAQKLIMDSKAIFLLILLCSAKATTAQPRIGIQLGGSLYRPVSSGTVSSFNGDMYNISGSDGGFAGGIFVHAKVGRQLFLRPSLEISFGKINETAASNSYPSYTNKHLVSFLHIPIPVVYQFKGKSGLYAGGGPALSIFMNSILMNGQNSRTLLKKADVAATVLAGYETEIGFSINLRYQFGFINKIDKEGSNAVLKNRLINFTVGYLF